MTHCEMRSRAYITSIESMILHRQLRWLGYVIRLPDSSLPHDMLDALHGQLKQDHMSVGGQKKDIEDHIKLILKNATFHLTDCGLLHPTELRGDMPVHMECNILTLNTILQQLSDAIADTCMPLCPAHIKIPLTIVLLVTDNATHALATTAT